jgi:hypothetical protein
MQQVSRVMAKDQEKDLYERLRSMSTSLERNQKRKTVCLLCGEPLEDLMWRGSFLKSTRDQYDGII